MEKKRLDGIESILSRFDGGRVLDVATLQGRFVEVLKSSLRSYSSIVGIDISERGIENARSTLGSDDVSFSIMNAEAMEFDDESFDTVCISASLHHLADVEAVLGEMKRVLKRGGRLIAVEMHRDAQTEAEFTSVYLHQWAAEVDSALGRMHKMTLTRRQILDHLTTLDLDDMEWFESRDTDADPMDPATIEELEKVIGMVAERADGVASSGDLRKRGQELMLRVREVGAQAEPRLLVTGLKRDMQ